jgi:hypothetical protein
VSPSPIDTTVAIVPFAWAVNGTSPVLSSMAETKSCTRNDLDIHGVRRKSVAMRIFKQPASVLRVNQVYTAYRLG